MIGGNRRRRGVAVRQRDLESTCRGGTLAAGGEHCGERRDQARRRQPARVAAASRTHRDGSPFSDRSRAGCSRLVVAMPLIRRTRFEDVGQLGHRLGAQLGGRSQRRWCRAARRRQGRQSRFAITARASGCPRRARPSRRGSGWARRRAQSHRVADDDLRVLELAQPVRHHYRARRRAWRRASPRWSRASQQRDQLAVGVVHRHRGLGGSNVRRPQAARSRGLIVAPSSRARTALPVAVALALRRAARRGRA